MARFVVVGGGVAGFGVSCAETLRQLCQPDDRVILISASPTIKLSRNVKTLSRSLVSFDVVDENQSVLAAQGIEFIHAVVDRIDHLNKVVLTTTGQSIVYDRVCVCAGAAPKLVAIHPCVVAIRDTETIQEFERRTAKARKVVIIGNGGVALELVHAIRSTSVVWVVRESTVGTNYFDEGAAKFLVDRLHLSDQSLDNATPASAEEQKDNTPRKRQKVSIVYGAALGPHWATALLQQGSNNDEGSLQIITQAELVSVETPSNNTWPARVRLSSGHSIDCDVVVSAVGVEPDLPFIDREVTRASDGGLAVDRRFRCSVAGLYAAGDTCTATWPHSLLWFQMRLWTQARIMGIEAARSMIYDEAQDNEDWLRSSFSFELFAHVTSFFNFKVILLGLFNGQTLGNDYSIQVRSTPGIEYIKVIMQDGRMKGAVLIGETDLEETFENLILNGTDLSHYDNLLDPDIDLEDFFD